MSAPARIVAVCVGPGGIPKRPVARAACTTSGLEGDAHRFRGHGGPDRALCFLSVEEVRALERDGVATHGPGTFGENLLIEGLDPESVRPGDRLRLGEDVLVEVTDVREPCGTLKKLDRRFPDLMLGRSGFLARVIREGELAPGMAIERLAGPAREG